MSICLQRSRRNRCRCHESAIKLSQSFPERSLGPLVTGDSTALEGPVKKIGITLSLGVLALSACGQGGGGQSGGGARNQIRIVGSSTVYPFSTSVAEQFTRNNPTFKAPII